MDVAAAVGAFCVRRAAELASPDDKGFVEQGTLLQVADQAGDGLIDLLSHLGMSNFQFTVLIPRLPYCPISRGRGR